MRSKIKLFIFIALVLSLAFYYYQQQRYESLSSFLFRENTILKNKIESESLLKKVDLLEKENKLLKDQIFQLEKQQFLFKSDQQNDKYKLEDALKFKDDTKNIKKHLEQEENKKEEDYKLTPSIEIDKDKRTIDGVKIEVETKF